MPTLNPRQWRAIAGRFRRCYEPGDLLALTDSYISNFVGVPEYRCGADWGNGGWIIDSHGEPGEPGAWEHVLTPGDYHDEAYVLCRRAFCADLDGDDVVTDLQSFARPSDVRKWLRAGSPVVTPSKEN